MALIEYRIEDSIAIITLNRIEKRNALNDAAVAELDEAVTHAVGNASVGVIAGAGKHFSAGLDLAEHKQKNLMEAIDGSRNWHATFSKIRFGKIPFVAALHGAVVGGGMELAACCHLRVADQDTYFALPEGQRGIFVGGGGSVNISRLVGVPRMTDMMLTGRVFNASEAESFAAVNYVTENGGSFDKAMELAKSIAGNSALTNYLVVNGLQRVKNSGFDEGLFFESMLASLSQNSPEAIERLNAFLNKTAPRLNIPTEGKDEG